MRYDFPALPSKADVGDFPIAAIGLDHGHIFDMLQKLQDAGARVQWLYGFQEGQAEQGQKLFPGARVARCEAEILDDPTVRLVASAGIPAQRCEIGLRAMAAGKDYFADKAPLTTLTQLAEAKAAVQKTGRKYACCYSERVSSKAATLADALIAQGAIGEVVQVIGMGPHRMSPQTRPDWFFDRALGGGILVDIGSHQAEQFLHYAGTDTAWVTQAEVRNAAHPQYPKIHDFGEMNLKAASGTSGHFRLDWLTPDGLPVWGDGRVFLLGTKGYLELRKVYDISTGKTEVVYLADQDGLQSYVCEDSCGFPFFPALLRDCVTRGEEAMTQAHVFAAIELAIRAQELAEQEK